MPSSSEPERASPVFKGLSQLVFNQLDPSYRHHLPAHLTMRFQLPSAHSSTSPNISLSPVLPMSFGSPSKSTHLVMCLFALHLSLSLSPSLSLSLSRHLIMGLCALVVVERVTRGL